MTTTIVGLVVQGRKLSAKDANGLSDPYLEIGLVNKKGEWVFADSVKDKKPLKSKVVRKTLSPTWRQHFDFVVPPTAKAFKIQVWDWDFVGAPEFMGEALVQLSDMTSGKDVEVWLPLKTRPSKPKEEVSGDVFVRYTYQVKKQKGEAAVVTTSEEESSLEDIRSGDIDLITQAILKYPNSETIQAHGVTALFKWGATAQPKDRLVYLTKSYPQGNILDVLYKSTQKFSSVPIIQFYGLGAVTHFSKLVESKPLVKEELIKALVKSVQDPPQMTEENRNLHVSNCFIILANLCTFKFDQHYNDAVKKCQLLTQQAGGVQEAVNWLKKSEHELLIKCALSLLVKCVRLNDKIRDNYLSTGVVEEILKLLKKSKVAMIKWLAIDVIETFVNSENKAYAESVLSMSGFVKQLNVFQFAKAEGSHPASLATIAVYCFEALSRYLTDAQKNELVEEKMVEGFLESYSKYKKYIPTENQKPIMAERLLRLLATLATHNGCKQAILKGMDSVIFIISNNANKNDGVQKMVAKLFEALLDSSSVAVLKEKGVLKVLEAIEPKSKLFDKIKEKL